MNSRIRAAEVIIRMFLVCVFLITTLIPSSSAAAHIAREWRANHPDVSPKKDLQPLTSLPKREAIYYNPAFTDPPPMRFSPEPDEPPPDLPAKEEPLPVEFWLEASPRGVGFTGIVTIQATIRNNTDAELLDLKFVDELEDGLGFVSSDDKLVSFDKGTRTVTASIKSVGVGEEFIFSYKLQATASGQDRQAKGRMWLHGAELFFQDQNKILTTRTPLIVGRYTVASDQDIDIVNLDGGWSQVGETSIYFDRGFFANEAIVTSSPVRVAGSGPDLQFKLELYEIEGVSRDSRKVPDEQKREIRKAITGNFAEPAYIEVNFDQVADLDSIPAGKEAFVATYDEAHQVWVKVPILSLDYQDNTVLVAAAKFSIWGAGLGDSMPQNGANVLLFDQPYTSLFTGSARYSIPIWTPPGRGDMAPSIALSYSSATVDGVLGDVQAPWVGVGWNIDSIEIVRKITTDENGYGYENDFALTLNGALHELIQDETDPTRFHTERGSFLYIERHNVALGNDEGENNTTGEWWEVVATDGTRYQLGRNSDSEQLALMYGYECIIGSPCNTPEGPYASLGYAGIAEDLVALRWRVDRITDTHDNYIDYTYMEDHPDPNSQIPAFDRASYMSSIKYTGHLDSQGVTDVNPGYEVKFILADRSGVGDGQPTDFNIWDNYDEKYLDKIEIYCTGCGIVDDPVIRTYDFSYSAPSAPNSQGTLVLDDISITGGDYPENEISIPNTTSATVKFTYENKDNREVTGEDDPWTYPRLTVIDNGYEGTLTYTYENDGRGTNSWYNWRVSKVMVDSGVGSPGTAAVMEYTYDTPKYTGIGSNPDLGELIGYTYNTETSYEFDETTEILDIKHHFGTEGLDIGREIWTEWIDPSTSDVLRKMENTYVTDNSQAPFEGWNYRYLAQVENYERIGSSLSMINKTTYQRDGGTGNLVLQVTYLGSTPYRKQYYEYVTNSDPEVHILDRVSRQVLADANNVVYADTRYQYDSGGTLTQGELSLMQTLTGSGSQTVDTGYTYDDYGNVISTKAYESYGTLGTSPNGEYQNTSSIYDTTFYTYPLTVANDLGYEVNTTYFRSMGLPFTVADPNNVITQTKYDGLGRVLSVTIPNEDEVGSVGFQYEYPTPAGGIVPAPYNIEMQIRDTIAIGDPFRSVWGIYDGLGRIIQNQVDDADNGKLLVTDTSFNAQGVVDKQSVPQSLSGTGGTYISPSWEAIDKTATAYDLLGRTTQIIAPGNIISQMAYSGLTTTVTDANGNNVKRETDGLGRLKTVKEYINSSDLYSTTSYYYDIKDQLEDVVDSQFNVTALTYNWLGQKIQMIDPDMGSWYYAYDSLGNLERQTDAELQRICFYYDSLNRLTGKYYHNSDSCPDEPTMDITYTYDTGAGQKGFRTGMGDESGTTTWTYSNAGRTVQETRNITGTSQKIFTTTTDWLGRVESIVNPDETITYTYDALGRPENFSSSDISGVTLADLAYNTFGQITSVALGNGALISNDYDTENSTFRLKNRSVDVGPTNLLDFEYFYDLVGNITQINDNKLGEIITYQYDDLNRLTSAEAISDTDYAYRQQFEYDKVGNILEVSEWSEDVIFKDDFESGDLSAWSSSVTDGGDLSATNSGPRVGDYSLQATLDDTNSIYVTDTSPDSETRYRARLYLDPVMLTMTAGDAFQLFGAYTNTPTQIVKVELAKSGSSYQVRASVLNDSSSFTDSSWVTISNDWTSVEIDWSAASGAGQDDGYLTLWIDGEQEANLTSVDNDTHTVTEARLGALADLDSGTSGALYLDAFESRSITYIGMLPDIDPPPPPTPPPPLLNGLISYWKLDETSGTRIDSVGSRDLTDNNTVGYTTGKQSNAADFERGNTEYLSYDTPYGTATDGDVSISVWINMESLGGDYYGSGIIASYRNPNVAGDWNIAVTNDGRIRFYRKESGTDYYWQTGTSEISTSTWYHLVVTYDDAGNSASCYINNASKSFSVVNAEVSWGTTALTVGRNFTTQNFYHDGLLDELAVYDRVLTTPEVAQLYNSGDGLTYPFSDGGAALPRNNSGSNEVASAGDDVLTSNPVAGNLGNTYSDILYRPIPPIAPPSQPIQRPLQLASLNTGLVAYWDLDEESSTRFDSIGSNHLADNNTVEYGAGKISNGADFVSANDEYLSIADNSNLSTGDVDFTVGLWVKLDDKTSNRAFVWKGNGDQTNLEYALMYNAVADRFRFLITDNGIANYHHVDANTLGSPAIDTWYHIIAWHDAANDTLNIQVDNETADSIFYASGLTDTTYAFALGGDQDQASFDGLMDEVGFWKKVLNADERASLYNYGSGNTYPFSDPTPTPTLTPTITPTFTLTPTPTVSVSDLTTKLLAYWKLDEASGNRADSYGSNMLIDNNSVGQGSGIVKENSADFESSSNHWFSLNTPISFADQEESTLFFWIDREDDINSYLTGSQSTTHTMNLQLDGDVKFYNDSGTPAPKWTSVLNEEPHSLCFTLESNRDITLYIDGVSQGTHTFSTHSAYTIDVIGNSGAGDGDFDGLLDEFAIFNDTLTQDEIDYLHNNGFGRTLPFTDPAYDQTPSPTPTDTPTATSPPMVNAHWNFNEGTGTTAADDSGNNNTLTLYNDTTWADGVGSTGKALYLDGVGDYAMGNDSASLKPTNGFSLSAWIYPEGFGDADRYIFNKVNDYGLKVDEDGFLHFFIPDLTPTDVTGPIPDLNEWTNVIGVYDKDNAQIKLYVNSVLVSSKDVTGYLNMGVGKPYIGTASGSWNGRVDEITLYGRPLSANEITSLYNDISTQPTMTPTATYTPTPETHTPTYTPTPSETPTPTATLTMNETRWGNGADGSLSVSLGNSYNIHTEGNAACADGGDAVAYSVTTLTTGFAILSTTPGADCLSAGDEIMIINLRGTQTYYLNTGRYEFLRVASVDTEDKKVTFTTGKVGFYGEGINDDYNIGTSVDQQRVMLMRVPNYTTVDIDGILTGNAFNGYRYGVISFRASDTITGFTGEGSIDMLGLGFDGGEGGDGPSTDAGLAGESYVGVAESAAVNAGGGGGGGVAYNRGHGGGGGGYGQAGGGGPTQAGEPYGSYTLSKMYLGSGGGGGGAEKYGEVKGGNGGEGGGSIFVAAYLVDFSGSISTEGADGYSNGAGGYGGGGSGGSVRVEGYTVSDASITAAGGEPPGVTGTRQDSGPGGAGRIAVFYENSLSSLDAIPYAHTEAIYSGAQPTPTATALVFDAPGPYGTGNDGDVTIAGGAVADMHTDNLANFRACADGGENVSYSVINLTSNYAQLSMSPSPGCLVPGDEVLLINLQGSSSYVPNVGNYEFLRIGAIYDNAILFTSAKTNYYGENAEDDTNMGVGVGQQRV
ncbi:MAG: SpvB/TcaC N-terminal domain-containing protein, partial [Anaerolineales bacterium]